MFKRYNYLPFFAFTLLAACGDASTSSTSVGASSDALRGTVTSFDAVAHHLSLHTASGDVSASWQSPEVRHGVLDDLRKDKEIELHGHLGEREFEIEAIELEPELADDHGVDADGGTDDKGQHADGGRGGDDDGGRGTDGAQPGDDHGGKGKP